MLIFSQLVRCGQPQVAVLLFVRERFHLFVSHQSAVDLMQIGLLVVEYLLAATDCQPFVSELLVEEQFVKVLLFGQVSHHS
jgi:hypothetical protein